MKNNLIDHTSGALNKADMVGCHAHPVAIGPCCLGTDAVPTQTTFWMQKTPLKYCALWPLSFHL